MGVGTLFLVNIRILTVILDIFMETTSWRFPNDPAESGQLVQWHPLISHIIQTNMFIFVGSYSRVGNGTDVRDIGERPGCVHLDFVTKPSGSTSVKW